MNKDYLNRLLDNPALISETDSYSLEQLCRQFPYFSVPFLLLAHAHKQKNDYRASDTLHSAALRLSKRPWLRAFIEPHTPENKAVTITETGINAVASEIPAEMLEQEITALPVLHIEESIIQHPVEQTEITSEPVAMPKLKKRRPAHEPLPAYSIEQYFPETREEPSSSKEPTDFYSWLKQPKRQDNPPPVAPAAEKKQDDLIAHFLRNNPSISRPKKEFFNPLNVAKKSEQMDDNLVTETLAHIYWKQKNLKAALQAFERLMLKFPEKRPYFAGLIQRISNELNQS